MPYSLSVVDCLLNEGDPHQSVLLFPSARNFTLSILSTGLFKEWFQVQFSFTIQQV